MTQTGGSPETVGEKSWGTAPAQIPGGMNRSPVTVVDLQRSQTWETGEASKSQMPEEVEPAVWEDLVL